MKQEWVKTSINFKRYDEALIFKNIFFPNNDYGVKVIKVKSDYLVIRRWGKKEVGTLTFHRPDDWKRWQVCNLLSFPLNSISNKLQEKA